MDQLTHLIGSSYFLMVANHLSVEFYRIHDNLNMITQAYQIKKAAAKKKRFICLEVFKPSGRA